MNQVPKMFIDTEPQQAPVFTTHLTSQENLIEGQHVHLEAQVEPRADANLRTEWYKNGLPLTTGKIDWNISRFADLLHMRLQCVVRLQDHEFAVLLTSD